MVFHDTTEKEENKSGSDLLGYKVCGDVMIGLREQTDEVIRYHDVTKKEIHKLLSVPREKRIFDIDLKTTDEGKRIYTNFKKLLS